MDRNCPTLCPGGYYLYYNIQNLIEYRLICRNKIPSIFSCASKIRDCRNGEKTKDSFRKRRNEKISSSDKGFYKHRWTALVLVMSSFRVVQSGHIILYYNLLFSRFILFIVRIVNFLSNKN